MIVPNVTLPEIYARIRWSFEQLAKGVWPRHDFEGNRFTNTREFRCRHAGKPLMGGRIGVLDGILGDWQYLADTFGIRHYGNVGMCHLCQASKNHPDR
eukprot:8398673-Alexandrium_andersonii.AAC.1